MMIVLEGPDASDKSTLAKVIAKSLRCDIQESEGPPRSEHDLDDRRVVECDAELVAEGVLEFAHEAGMGAELGHAALLKRPEPLRTIADR